MKKINYLLPIVLLMGLTSCKTKSNSVYEQTSRVELDLNPSIELYVDKDNKIVSCSALNDDGSVLLYGEVMVGKSLEDAAKKYVELTKEMGYLVKDAVDASTNEFKIIVDGAKNDIDNLYNAAKGTINDYLTKNNIKAEFDQVVNKTIDEIKQELVDLGEYTKEQVDAFKESEVYEKIANAKAETTELLTNELKEAYYQAKEYKIEFAEKQYTKDVINQISVISGALYNSAVSSLEKSIESLETIRFNNLISSESNYQKTLNNLRNAKDDLLKNRNIKLSIADEQGNEYILAEANYQLSEQAYNNVLTLLNGYYETANGLIDSAVGIINNCLTLLKGYEDAISNLATTLQNKASELETKVNEVKANAFNEFETAHINDINAINNALKAQKEALQAEFNK